MPTRRYPSGAIRGRRARRLLLHRSRPRTADPAAKAGPGQCNPVGQRDRGSDAGAARHPDGRDALFKHRAAHAGAFLSGDARAAGRIRSHGARAGGAARAAAHADPARQRNGARPMEIELGARISSRYSPARHSRRDGGPAAAARQAGPTGRGQRLGVPGRYLPRAHRRARNAHQDSQGEAMKRLTNIAAVAALAVALPAASPARASEELAKKHACFACHTVDKKMVGPSYKDVAAKYRGDKGGEAKLVDKVKKGGTGVWGQVPMPPNAAVPDADIQALVKWILSQK